MNKKILIPIMVIAVILPVIAFSTISDDDRLGKEFARNNHGVTIGIHTLEEDISEQEEIDRSEIIVEGIIMEVKPFWKVVNDDANPSIYSEYAVKISNVIKGNVQKDDTVSVMTSGGTLDGVTTKTESIVLEQGDNVIMLLGKDINSVWGNSYHPVSITKSTYIIDDDQAKNKLDSRTMSKSDLVDKLNRLTGN